MQKLTTVLSTTEDQLRGVGDIDRAHQVHELCQALDQPDLRVVVFGEFNRGKSTLINALLGRLVLPAKLIPTTGHVTRVVFGSQEEIRVQHVNGALETASLDRLDSFSSLNHDGRVREDVAVIEVAVNAPLLRDGLVLLDTPGVNERPAQTRRAQTAIAGADLVLLVLDARQLLGSAEHALTVDWLVQELNKPVVPVVNFMNFIEDADQSTIRQRLDNWSRTHLRNELGRFWFEVNALGALAYTLGKGSRPTDDFEALADALAACRDERRRDLQVRSRRGQLRAEVREGRQQNAQVLNRLRADTAQVERERVAAQQALQDLRRRFDASARTQRDRLGRRAPPILDRHLASLINFWFKGGTRASLEANADRWYANQLTDAVREIEKQADRTLRELAGDLGRPDPLTIRERMILNARLAVGELPTVRPSETAIGWGAGVGAVLGTMAIPIPVIGTAVGAVLGGWLTNVFGSSEPDYVAAYAGQVRTQWEQTAREVLVVLHAQYDARIADVKRQIDERLEQSRGEDPPLAVELRRREVLDEVLAQAEDELRNGP